MSSYFILTPPGDNLDFIDFGLNDYTARLDAGILILSRTVAGQDEIVKITAGNSNGFARLIFADGNVPSNQLATLNATIKAFSRNSANITEVDETFATTKPGAIQFAKNEGHFCFLGAP
jgi:hypothetical protein